MFFNFDDIEFQVLAIQRSRCNRSLTVAPRAYSAISIRLEGNANFVFEKKNFSSPKGSVVFIPSGVGYKVEYEESEAVIIKLNRCNYQEVEELKIDFPDTVVHLFKQIFDLWKKGCDNNTCKAAVYTIFAKINESYAASENHIFTRCKTYIEEHYLENDLKLSDICKHGNISEMCLYRYFMKYMGIPPKQYAIKLRLSYAMEFILNKAYPIAQIAKMSGFTDEKYFARLFKKNYGTSPSHYIDYT